MHDVLQRCAADSTLCVFDDSEFCALPDPEWAIDGVFADGQQLTTAPPFPNCFLLVGVR